MAHTTGSLDMQARFWDGEKLEQRKSFSQDWKVESVSFCPERSRFVVGGEDMYAHLYDYETGTELECNRGVLSFALHRAPVLYQKMHTMYLCARIWQLEIVVQWDSRPLTVRDIQAPARPPT